QRRGTWGSRAGGLRGFGTSDETRPGVAVAGRARHGLTTSTTARGFRTHASKARILLVPCERVPGCLGRLGTSAGFSGSSRTPDPWAREGPERQRFEWPSKATLFRYFGSELKSAK